MIRVEEHEGVTHFRMARVIAGWAVYWTGCYWVDGLLVDAGPPVAARELVPALADRRIDGLVITHHHEDHMGGAPAIVAARGVTARAHRNALPFLSGGFPQEPYRRLAWGRPPRVDAQPIGERVETRHHRLDVLFTPGHSPDHVCLHDRERGWLFTGDLFLAERLRFLRDDEDLEGILGSLDLVCALDVRTVLCAHRGVVRDGGAALVRKRDRLRTMVEAIREGLARGDSVRAITRRVVGREGPMSALSLGRFAARNFVHAVRRMSR